MIVWRGISGGTLSLYGRILGIAALLLVADIGNAGIYKWTDADGRVHYSEIAPTGQDSQQLRTSPAPRPESSETDDSADRMMQQMEMESRAGKKRDEERAKAFSDRADAEKKVACARAKQVLELLQRQERIFTQKPDGERIYLEDDARARAIENAQKVADENC